MKESSGVEVKVLKVKSYQRIELEDDDEEGRAAKKKQFSEKKAKESTKQVKRKNSNTSLEDMLQEKKNIHLHNPSIRRVLEIEGIIDNRSSKRNSISRLSLQKMQQDIVFDSQQQIPEWLKGGAMRERE